MNDLTDEQKADVADRIERFKDGHRKLVEELMVDIVPAPVYVPVTPYSYATALNMEYKDLKYSAPSPIHLDDQPPQTAS